MHSRKQLAEVIDQIFEQDEEAADIEQTTVEEYKKLDNKCSRILERAKKRKQQTN
jgi:hypothetical protein